MNDIWSFTREVPTPNNEDPLARSHQELWGRSVLHLGPVSDLITRHRNSVFGHIARLSEDMPAHQALRCHVGLTLGHLPDQSWKRCPGRPNNRRIDQLCRDNNNTPPADLWRRSTTRGHTGVTLWSSMTMRWWWRRVKSADHAGKVRSVYVKGSVYEHVVAVTVKWCGCLFQNAFVTIYLINSFTKLIDMAVQVADIAGTTHRFVDLCTLDICRTLP